MLLRNYSTWAFAHDGLKTVEIIEKIDQPSKELNVVCGK